MAPTSLAERLIIQLTPAAALVTEIIDSAYARYSVKALASLLPLVDRDAHRARVSGLLVWQHVADGLVAAGSAERLPDGFVVLTSDKQHNSGRYLIRFPGGLLTIRRSPHDDEKDEGQFMQDSFAGMIEELDRAAMPDEQHASRVWLRIAPDGASAFTAQDRHGYQVKVPLVDLLHATAAPAAGPALTPGTTQVRSRLGTNEQSDAR